MRPVDHQDVTDGLDHRGALGSQLRLECFDTLSAFTKLGRAILAQLDLDQFVTEKRLVDLRQHWVGQARLSYLHYRIEGVRQTPQVVLLLPSEVHAGDA